MCSFLALSSGVMLIPGSENPAVTRGTKAISVIQQITGRIPTLIQQSHLERNDGAYPDCQERSYANSD